MIGGSRGIWGAMAVEQKWMSAIGTDPWKEVNSDTITLVLDGTAEQVQKNYKNYVNSARFWNYKHGMRIDTAPVCGTRRHVFTTPEEGTCYVRVMHEKVLVTFVIQARNWWLKGYCVGDTVFEILPDKDEPPYMPHKSHKMLPFKGNHNFISSSNPGGLTIGLHHLRKTHRSLVQNGANQEPQALGLFVLYLCEGPKLQPAFLGLCTSLVDPGLSRLDKIFSRITDMIQSWSHLSRLAMEYMDCIRQGLPPPELTNKRDIPDLETIQSILEIIRILHLDAYNKGMFIHSPESPKTWQVKDQHKSKSKQKKDIKRRKKEAEGTPAPKGGDAGCTDTLIDDTSFHSLGITGKIQSLTTEEKNVPGCSLKDGRHGCHPQKTERMPPIYVPKRHMSTKDSKELGLVVLDEEDSDTLLVHNITSEDIYRKQEETIISWRDPGAATELALSFQEGAGCSYIWDNICDIQRNLQFSNLGALEVGPRPASEHLEASRVLHLHDEPFRSVNGELRELPPVELSNLPLILKTILEGGITDQMRVAELIIQDLLDIFRMCEDLENLDDLHMIFKLVRGIILLNSQAIFDKIFSEEFILDIIGALEYDPEVPKVQKHRIFLKDHVVFKEAIPIKNVSVVSKIHQTYRVGYLKDVILPRILDDATLASLNTMIHTNNAAVISLLKDDTCFIQELFSRMRMPNISMESKRELTSGINSYALKMPQFSNMIKGGGGGG